MPPILHSVGDINSPIIECIAKRNVIRLFGTFETCLDNILVLSLMCDAIYAEYSEDELVVVLLSICKTSTSVDVFVWLFRPI